MITKITKQIEVFKTANGVEHPTMEAAETEELYLFLESKDEFGGMEWQAIAEGLIEHRGEIIKLLEHK